jgi:hypothetical protein
MLRGKGMGMREEEEEGILKGSSRGYWALGRAGGNGEGVGWQFQRRRGGWRREN